jgi:hypothetical protein
MFGLSAAPRFGCAIHAWAQVINPHFLLGAAVPIAACPSAVRGNGVGLASIQMPKLATALVRCTYTYMQLCTFTPCIGGLPGLACFKSQATVGHRSPKGACQDNTNKQGWSMQPGTSIRSSAVSHRAPALSLTVRSRGRLTVPIASATSELAPLTWRR